VPEVAVSCDATAEQLGEVHHALARFWRGLDPMPADDWRMRFELAVSEIAANIIEHAQPHVMNLRLRVHSGNVIAEFADSGLGWEGPPEPSEVLDDLAETGRGLELATTAVDDLVYERTGSTNRWQLVKRM
jgi:serine/threonine-protein kinase RsbW